ncbi:gliding motility lipoprotein GldB [uncultured Winogradskyella sp.]|uniref:gliding motility lipoprotein GldB n=1 Tax=uncultured Winogradskyella sp. TaxID=395353 RepID=UPI0026353252|nr:gliding motility lipoprotein GldB [uncultured Winogradskyella sp.]
MKLRIYILIILGLFFVSCTNDSELENEISKIKVDFVVERFDKAVLKAQPKDLPQLKKAYPFLFSKQVPDSVWVNRINDTLQDMLLTEVNVKYANFKDQKRDLKQLFQHIKYYDKTFSTPRVITLTNDVDYRNKTIVTDSLVLIALDNFLGADHQFYQNISKYLSANLREGQIITSVAEDYAKRYIFQNKRKTFLDEMIYFGKILYFKDLMIPKVSDAEKMGYTEDQLNWAIANESAIWSYFIEKELLYSTDNKLHSRFIADAPYSKFYLQLDNESPGRLGQYIGWQIVSAYAESTDEDPLSILQKDSEELFRKSKFKPKKNG